MTRPAHSLSTLRRMAYPTTTQDLLPDGWPAFPGGCWLPAGSQRKVSGHPLLLPQASPGALYFYTNLPGTLCCQKKPPKEKFDDFGMAALLAPVVGPTLGGFITDNYGWRWIFYLNLPVGTLALWMCSRLVFDPPEFKAAQLEASKKGGSFDTLGLCLLSVTMVAWEVVLSKGQEWDWFGDPFFRVQTLAALFVLGLGGLIFWESRQRFPVVNF